MDGNKKAIRRNKLITGVLYYSKDMETFATGLKRIKDLCDEAGCKVEFRSEKDDFVVVFYRNLRNTWGEKGNLPADDQQDVSKLVSNETTLKQVLKQVLKQADYDKLLAVIDRLEKVDEISVKDVMALTGRSRTTAWRYIQILVDAKILEPTGNTNNSVYKRLDRKNI